MAPSRTRFGSLEHYEKGGVEVINDDARHYVFSNMFEVASKAKPYEKVAVGKNIEYVIEAIRAEGTSRLARGRPRRVRAGDGRRGRGPAASSSTTRPLVPAGSQRLDRRSRATRPASKMGRVRARRGHMTLLPAGAAYQFHAARARRDPAADPAGRDTVERWAEICQTTPRPQA